MTVWRHLLWPLAFIYGTAVFFRNRMFDLGILPARKCDIPIISVGNLETGGTGKSPLVIYIAQILLNEGVKVAILSRGFGRKSNGFQLVGKMSTSEQVGDEPLQAKLRMPDCLVAVCNDRVEGIDVLLARNDRPEVIILDDGFQHRWVKPSLSVLVTPSSFPFKRNFILPVGNLREPAFEALRADLTVFTGLTEQLSSDQLRMEGTFYSYTRNRKIVQFSGPQVDDILINDVVIFSGIANSDRFSDAVAERFNVVLNLEFRDHHQYRWNDLRALQNLDSFGPAVKAVITTEKDAARLQGSEILEKLKHIPIFYLPIDIEFHEMHENAFDKLILDHGKHA